MKSMKVMKFFCRASLLNFKFFMSFMVKNEYL